MSNEQEQSFIPTDTYMAELRPELRRLMIDYHKTLTTISLKEAKIVKTQLQVVAFSAFCTIASIFLAFLANSPTLAISAAFIGAITTSFMVANLISAWDSMRWWVRQLHQTGNMNSMRAYFAGRKDSF